MRFAVVGVTGMLGSMAFRLLAERHPGEVYGSARSEAARGRFAPALAPHIVTGVDAGDIDSVAGFLRDVRPDVVINCVGVVKQLASANDPLVAIPLNALFPHRLARLCDLVGARLIHVSTDCVFTGRKGNYTEEDASDASDLYGCSKFLGEVDYPNAVTLRTSIIGRELGTRNGLVEWFLNARGPVGGYTRAIFSGLTTDELTRVIDEHVVPSPSLRGVHHVSVEPIAKYDLLKLVKASYGLDTEITPNDAVAIDRSLDSSRFRTLTGYAPPPWETLIATMRALETQSEPS